jgi:hypothetical protein
MTTATTIYRNYESFGSLRSDARSSLYGSGLDDEGFDASHDSQRRACERQMAGSHMASKRPTTIFVRFVEMDVESLGDLVPMTTSVAQDVELSLFVPIQPKSTRKVRFHVRKRESWTPNPLLAVHEEQW